MNLNKEEAFLLGKVSKPHGFKGDVTILIDSQNAVKYSKIKSFFLELGNSLVPFFISKIQATTNNRFIVHFEGVDTEEEARRISGKNIYLHSSFLPKLKKDEFFFHELVGFTIIDEQGKTIGVVEDIMESLAHPILKTTSNNKEVLIPLPKDFIISVERELKEIHLRIPEGLLDL